MGKTAGELTARELDRYRRLAREQDQEQSRQIQARHERAMLAAHRAAEILRAEFPVQRVILFGSLATGSWFHRRSDIDLAVEGLNPADYWRADCRLEQIDPDLEVDLVDLATAPPALREAVRREGTRL